MKSFDDYHAKGYQTTGNGKCGTPGQLSGIQFTFPFNSLQDLPDIPFNKLVEVPFTVTQSLLCDDYIDLEVQIVSTCESNMDIYQYGITEGKLDYSTVLSSPVSSTGIFSARWPPSGGRRILSAVNQSSVTDLASLKELTSSHTEFVNKLFSENEERIQRMLAETSNQTELLRKLLVENEERMQRMFIQYTYFGVGLFLLLCTLIGVILLLQSEKFRGKN